MESLKSLVAGGIAFATPDGPAQKPVKEGTVFRLHEQAQKKWLEWTPKISIPPEQ